MYGLNKHISTNFTSFWEEFFRIRAILIFILFSVPFNLHAQNQKIEFDHLSVEDGLSHSTVMSILQDSNGFMWFATLNGLNRFDGYNFKEYRYDKNDSLSLRNNFVVSMYEDKSGIIWIGTYGGGLHKFDREQGTFKYYVHNVNNSMSLSNDIVWSIYEDKAGVLWVGTDDGLNKFDKHSEQFVRYYHDKDNKQSISSNRIKAICEDKKGLLWIGTYGGGLNKADKVNDSDIHFARYKHDPFEANSLSNNNVRSMYKDHDGVLWVGTNGGINKVESLISGDSSSIVFSHYVNDPNDPYSLSNNSIWTIFEDRSGTMWFGSDEGLNVYDKEKNQFIRYAHDPLDSKSLSHNFVRSIFQDNTGVLWIGSHGGVDKFDSNKKKFFHFCADPLIPFSMSDNSVWSILVESSGVIWIGTQNGLDRGTRKQTSNSNEEQIIFTDHYYNTNTRGSLSNDFIRVIFQDKQGTIWVGTNHGLNKYDELTNQFTQYLHDSYDPKSLSNNQIGTIYEDQSGVLWVGTNGGGLNRMDKEKEEFFSYTNHPNDINSLSNNSVWSIYEDKTGILWIGTNEGLNEFDKNKEEFKRYINDPENPDDLSDDAIWTINEDKDGNLWIGTSGGLNKLDKKSGHFMHYRENDGLSNDVVLSAIEDDSGKLWLSTSNGLSKFSPKYELFTNFFSSDGLQSNEFNWGAHFKDSSGKLYFGGPKGLNVFYPDSIKVNTYKPTIAIVDFQIFNKTVSPIEGPKGVLSKTISNSKEANLTYEHSVFSIEFTALHYSAPNENQFAYMMEGFDEDWIYTNSARRIATYTNLDPGDYTFRVTGSNNDGVWNEQTTSLNIHITPPWWGTVWFRFAAVFSFILGIIKLFQWRNHMLIRRKEILKTQVKLQTHELQQMNKELASTLEMVEHRTRELEIVNKELESFSYSVTHDLRAPLKTIEGFTDIIKEEYFQNIDVEADRLFEIVKNNIDRMSELITDLLAFSELGNEDIQLKSCNLNKLAQGAADDLLNSYQDNKTKIVINKLPKKNIDKSMMRQVFINLLSNSIKFSKNRTSPEIEVGHYVSVEGEDVLFIRDNGVGFDLNYKDKLFAIFQRLHSEEDFEGTGIGLSMVKRILDKHHGKIWAESEVDKGATFFFSIP